MKRKVILAKSAGFCFGVERAVKIAGEAAEESGEVFTYGPIIHNEAVVNDLKEKGVGVVGEEDAVRDKTVIIRSHGVSKSVTDRLESDGNRLIDATCPFVKKIHRIVSEHSEAGEQIVIIGTASHPEVVGITGWCATAPVFIENEADAEAFEADRNKKICVVSQTTFAFNKFHVLVEILKQKGYDVIAYNTICNATEERQSEAAEIAAKVDVMLVIGGTHSSNSRKLFELCSKICERTYFLQSAEDLEPSTLQSIEYVGITAGASTPNNIIEEVQKKCQI